MIAATVWDAIAQHGATFLLGLLVGLVASSRYRIVRVRDQWTATDVAQALTTHHQEDRMTQPEAPTEAPQQPQPEPEPGSDPQPEPGRDDPEREGGPEPEAEPQPRQTD
jgi:hypothetical protein